MEQGQQGEPPPASRGRAARRELAGGPDDAAPSLDPFPSLLRDCSGCPSITAVLMAVSTCRVRYEVPYGTVPFIQTWMSRPPAEQPAGGRKTWG